MAETLAPTCFLSVRVISRCQKVTPISVAGFQPLLFHCTEDSDCPPACWAEVQIPALLGCRPHLLLLFTELWHQQCREAPAAGQAVMIPTEVLNQEANRALWGSTWLGNTAYFICPLLRLNLSCCSHLIFPLVTCFTVKAAQAVSVFRTKALQSPYTFLGLTKTVWVLVLQLWPILTWPKNSRIIQIPSILLSNI